MLPILLQTLILASSGFLSFGSMTLVILMLLSGRGWRNGFAYWLGYFVAYTTLGSGVVALDARSATQGNANTGKWVPLLLLALGVFLLVLSWRNAHKPATPSEHPPRFFTIVENITPVKSFGFGALITILNFKNLGLFLSALSAVMLSVLPLSQKLIITLLATLEFCAVVGLPLLIYFLFPRRAAHMLEKLKTFLERHSRALGIWAPLLFGLLIVLKGLSLLS